MIGSITGLCDHTPSSLYDWSQSDLCCGSLQDEETVDHVIGPTGLQQLIVPHSSTSTQMDENPKTGLQQLMSFHHNTIGDVRTATTNPMSIILSPNVPLSPHVCSGIMHNIYAEHLNYIK